MRNTDSSKHIWHDAVQQPSHAAIRISILVQECDSFYLDSLPKISLYTNKPLQPRRTVGQVPSVRTFTSEVTQVEPGL